MDGLARWPAAGPSFDTSQPNAERVTPFRYALLKSSSHFRILRLKSVYVDASIPFNQHLHGSLVEVDSICINQGSDAEALAERSGQTAMMDLIYRSAR
ncbi:hypothetical protein GGTG_08105 [Gaeumannomyces tritici R3-111a-1]|uniref:Heterokaryon incompatibility domain-containing protein n=1 Tax=Gaeumannomyces tritici (strain R3-111a-1) TaxID=644352 RepID=J3P3L8_GAET3|nr:hypothetical protein GGTG_08105 [Gaeumannomyces tritici R3-111a-1]EJT74262.1 hypothetical protein GGTG_08105 [Gaeumannomyces tritici R3-111a-1]